MNSKYLDILKQYWGYDSFRGIQEEIITSVGEGRDTLGLMPTGGGKSICFQVPALAMEGVCIVVTPLIALMKDQVLQLRLRGIRADAVYSGMRHEDIIRVMDNAALGGLEFLYISPERLGTELFIAKLQRMRKVCMVVVDEAHCVSQWGYDFRPSYMKISEIRRYISSDVPILALTATATPRVVDDIQEQLHFREKNVFKMSFERKNLIYVVRRTKNRLDEMLHIIKSIPQGSIIVYVRNRKATYELAQYLVSVGITATNYHAGLTDAEKDFRQESWTRNHVRVMVATNAFGMGIDKPDVRLVIHYNAPDSIEAYFQEAGRAGRDGKTSYAVLLADGSESKTLHQRVPQTYPEPDYIRRVYEDMCCFLQVGVGEAEGKAFDFDRPKFCSLFKHFEAYANSALKLLSNAQYIDYCEEQDFKSALHIILTKEELNRLWTQSQAAEDLMQAILRNCPGIFSRYVYVEETMLARICGLTPEKVYEQLKEWNRNRILDYIPRRNTPTICFTQKRYDTERITLPTYVYLDRKKDYTERIDRMLEYITSNTTCRSRLLLEYFGDSGAHDCGRCDVCLEKYHKQNDKNTVETVRQAIVEMLSDGEKHKVVELKSLDLDADKVKNAMSDMLKEEQLVIDGAFIRLNRV